MTNLDKEYKWTNALGETKKFSELDHQHLSNIIWFYEVFFDCNQYNFGLYLANLELHKRFNNKKLDWKPLPISNEVNWIKNSFDVDLNGNIWHKNECIGSLSHIENWNIKNGND